MNSMGRYVLRFVVFGAIAIATSAAQKNQGLSTTSDNTTAACVPSEGACPKPHHHSKSKRAGSAAPSR
jgi:hypothetical protein